MLNNILGSDWKQVARRALVVGLAVLIPSVIVDGVFATDLATWQSAVSGAVAAGLAVVVEALRPNS